MVRTKEYIDKTRLTLRIHTGMTLIEAMQEIIDAPAADVVEVVRCCECVYHDDESQYHYCRKWRRNCPNDSDFFCKWGKRKDGGQEPPKEEA